MAMPAEMGLAILAGALGLGFSNIEKISRFKGAGFEAEMKMVQTIIESQTEPTSEQQEVAKKTEGIPQTLNVCFDVHGGSNLHRPETAAMAEVRSSA